MSIFFNQTLWHHTIEYHNHSMKKMLKVVQFLHKVTQIHEVNVSERYPALLMCD